MALDALPIREVISTSMEPSAEMRYVNEGPNSTSLPSMFIGVLIAEEEEIIVALVLVQLIDIPTLAASLLEMTGLHKIRRREWRNVIGVVHVGETPVVNINAK